MTITHTPAGAPVIGIAGWKNSGKTTLATRLIAEFTRRGLRVASVKHAHHGFEVDQGDTDSARHRRAGATEVAIVSSRRLALIRELPDAGEPALETVLAMLAPCDLVVVEGYKAAPIRKIEVRRRDAVRSTALAANDPLVLAIATDEPDTLGTGLPVFALDDIPALATFLGDRILAAAHDMR